MKFTWLLVLFTASLVGCNQEDSPQQAQNSATEPTPQPSVEAVKQEPTIEPIALKTAQKLKNGEDIIEFTGPNLLVGQTVTNLAFHQTGTVTGDIVVLLKENGVVPEIQGLTVVEAGKSRVLYRAMPDVDLIVAFKALKSDRHVKLVELQIYYTAKTNTDETM
jgi:hypothetical protein